MYDKYIQNRDDKVYKSNGNLDDLTITNMIATLTHEEFKDMYSQDEITLLKMTIKSNLLEKAKSTLYQTHEEEKIKILL